MDSPGHRANILNPDFTEIGIGIERGNFRGYDSVVVTQNFATTDGDTSEFEDVDAPTMPEPTPEPSPEPDPHRSQHPNRRPNRSPTRNQNPQSSRNRHSRSLVLSLGRKKTITSQPPALGMPFLQVGATTQ